MPDISMCQDASCPSHYRCYRFTATPDDLRQSYVNFDRAGEEECDAFWDNLDRYVRGKGQDANVS